MTHNIGRDRDGNPIMLWFDNDMIEEFSVKLDKAINYYRQKYGIIPNLCLVSLEVFSNLTGGNPDAELSYKGIAVKPDKYLLKYDMHIGRIEEVLG
jgi:hypothetical protein